MEKGSYRGLSSSFQEALEDTTSEGVSSEELEYKEEKDLYDPEDFEWQQAGIRFRAKQKEELKQVKLTKQSTKYIKQPKPKGRLKAKLYK